MADIAAANSGSSVYIRVVSAAESTFIANNIVKNCKTWSVKGKESKGTFLFYIGNPGGGYHPCITKTKNGSP